MSSAKNSLKFPLRLSLVALAASMAGCSWMPFVGDDDDEPAPVARTSTAPTSSSSIDPSASSAQQTGTYNQQNLERISEPVPLVAGAPDRYIVKEGDTLWDIASVFLRDPWYWPEVWFVNPQVENPHLIYPGDELSLVYIDGRQRIVNNPISAYRLSPSARVTPLDEAIESIPYEQIAAFLSKGMVLEKDQVDELPYILAVRGDHMVGAAGNQLYIRGNDQASPNGTRYSVVHVGDRLVDPDDGDVVGYQGIYVGEGALTRGGDPSTLALSETNREALQGDRLVPESVDIPLNFFPKAPDIAVDGRIISVVDGVSLIGQYQVVVMNRGARDGLAPGDVLSVYQDGDVVRDRFAGGGSFFDTSLGRAEEVKLPDERAGTLMVFKVYDRIGYGLIMEATDAIRVHDSVRNPD